MNKIYSYVYFIKGSTIRNYCFILTNWLVVQFPTVNIEKLKKKTIDSRVFNVSLSYNNMYLTEFYFELIDCVTSKVISFS